MTHSTAPVLTAPRPASRLDLGETLKDGWILFTKDWLALSVGIILAVILSIVPPLIIAPVVWAGVARMVLRRVREGRPAEISDVFSCFDRFLALWGLTLVVMLVGLGLMAIAALPVIGVVLSGGFETDANGNVDGSAIGAIGISVLLLFVMLVPLVYLQTIWTYAYYLVVDETRLGPIASLRESRRLVTGTGFWMTFLVVLVVGLIVGGVSQVIGSIGSVAGMFTMGVGSIPFAVISMVAYGFYYTGIASMYFQASGERNLLPSAYPGAPAAAYEGGGRQPAGPAWQASGVPPYGAPPAYGSAPWPPPPQAGQPPAGPAPPEPPAPPSAR